ICSVKRRRDRAAGAHMPEEDAYLLDVKKVRAFYSWPVRVEPVPRSLPLAAIKINVRFIRDGIQVLHMETLPRPARHDLFHVAPGLLWLVHRQVNEGADHKPQIRRSIKV